MTGKWPEDYNVTLLKKIILKIVKKFRTNSFNMHNMKTVTRIILKRIGNKIEGTYVITRLVSKKESMKQSTLLSV